jgi:hypothetical protein
LLQLRSCQFVLASHPSPPHPPLQPLAAWNSVITAELDGTKSGLARMLGKFHANQISAGFKIDTRLDDKESRDVFLLKAGGMMMPTEAFYLDDEYKEDRVKYITVLHAARPLLSYVVQGT